VLLTSEEEPIAIFCVPHVAALCFVFCLSSVPDRIVIVLVETKMLTKRYPHVTALDTCTFHVTEGEVFGLLGPNGAGKTTLLRLLLGFLRPTAGLAEICQLDCQRQSLEVRRNVAYLPGEVRLFRRMRGRDVLDFFASMRPGVDRQKARSFARHLDLDVSRRVANMSTGMRQKLALAVCLSADTRLVILDEPTANLDPTVRRTVLELVAMARQQGRTIIFSSHVLSEVEQACDRVILLRAGQLVHTQVVADLRRRHRIHATLNGPLPPSPPLPEGQLTVEQSAPNRVVFETPGQLAPVLDWLATLPLDEVRIEPLGLRSVYDHFHFGQLRAEPEIRRPDPDERPKHKRDER